ncbi:hypothetical protein QBC47DRAFT_117525 [Echria macrotheca]|uniref:Fungal N-terminal domain-containing protein n=1 Tax=Echria macrotheca TaxID=438768 RepID=A0AAJ0BN76_9PEZI|nr:hypothetical protein QBC47DRAFT_117525 [Echria macrotheca]
MADPLSIAASVAGLLGVAAKLSTVIGNFIANVSDAPESSRWALSVVTETRLTLQSIKDLMDRLPHLSRDRKDMIHIRHLVVVFREAVLSFSELEAMVCGNTQDNATPWQSLRVKWALEEDKIVKMIRRLQGHKTSLSTILNIIQCQSDIEARESLAKLQTTVDQLLQNQQQLLDRLERYETVLFETTSARFTGDGESESILIQRPPPARLPPATSAVSQGDPMLGLVLPADTSGSIAEKLFLREFELTLEQTRVYARVRSNKCDASVISSERGTATWSMLSGLSLNDISAISVLSLPISLEEMASIGPDLIFTHMLSNTQGSLHRVGGTPASAMKPGLIRFENPRASPRPPSSSVGTSVVELSKGLGNRGGNELFRIVVIGGEDNRENEMVNEVSVSEHSPLGF